VRIRAVPPDPRQEAAFHDGDVAAIVAELVAANDLRLVKLAHTVSIMSDPDPADVGYLIPQTIRGNDELTAVAERVIERAIAIATAPTTDDRRRRRGALLERLAHELVAVRRGDQTFHEHQVELLQSPRSRRSWTKPKEIIATGQFFEVYECKNDGMADLEDVDELSDIVTTARSEGTEPRATIVVAVSQGTIQIRAKTWRLTETLYLVTLEEILSLAATEPRIELKAAP
jgi:hypothetical protein